MLRAPCPHLGAGLDEVRMATGESSKEGAVGPIVDPGRLDSWSDEELPQPRGPSPWVIGGIVVVCGLFLVGFVAMRVVLPVSQEFVFDSQGKAMTDLTQIDSALEEYAGANAGRYPDRLLSLVAPDANGHTYLKGTRIPKDPWGNEYLYDPPEPGRPHPRVYSYGRDGLPGGEGDDADIDDLSLLEER